MSRRRDDRSRSHRELRGECPQYATRFSVVGAICRVVDTRGESPKPDHVAVDFRKIHPLQAIFGNFFGFFSEIFWTPRACAPCVARHGIATRPNGARSGVFALARWRTCAAIRAELRKSVDLVWPSTSKGLRVFHRGRHGLVIGTLSTSK